MLQEFAVDFQPPQKGLNGATGLYAGEQDLFCFLIDPTAGRRSKGKRSLRDSSFGIPKSASGPSASRRSGFRRFARTISSGMRPKSSSSPASIPPAFIRALAEMRRIIEGLVAKRDAAPRRIRGRHCQGDENHSSATTPKMFSRRSPAMAFRDMPPSRRLKSPSSEAGSRSLRRSMPSTRIAGELTNAGDRTDADERAGGLLALAL